MRFEQQLMEGTLVKRSTRFQAEVKLNNGDQIVAHCANPGSLKGCAEPGNKVLLSEVTNPRIKFKHQVEIVYDGRVPVGVHTARPISVVVEAIGQGRISQLAGYATLRSINKKTSPTPHADLIVEGNSLRPCFLHIQNVTMQQEGVAYYPDATLPAGIAAMQELTNLVREGNRAMIIFMVQRSDAQCFRPADHIDAEFCAAFRDAVARGVEPLCFRSKVSKKGIEFDNALPIDLGDERK